MRGAFNMAAKNNVGTLIREARTAKKISQEQLASQIDGLSGSDIGKAERGEKELTQTQLKAIAKILGITQKSLLEAPKGGYNTGTSKTSTAAKTSTSTKTTSTAAKKTSTTAKTSSTTAKKTSGTTAKTSSASSKTASTTAAKSTAASAKSLTAAEQKLIELYRTADSDSKKLATRILKGEKLDVGDLLPMLINPGSTGDDGLLGALLGKLQNMKK